MIGNVGEWLETVVDGTYRPAGGGFTDIPEIITKANFPPSVGSNGQDGYSTVGFRVASTVPEPAGATLVSLGLALLFRRRVR
jgi:hypothetical protein